MVVLLIPMTWLVQHGLDVVPVNRPLLSGRFRN